MSKKGKALIFSAVVILAIIILLILNAGNTGNQKQVKIGFIMSGSIEDTGWNGNHYTGIKEACEKLEAELLVKEEIKEFEGTCESAIRELANEGAQMIFLSSYGYNEEVHEIVTEYPQIVFYGIGSDYQEENLTHYFTRMYQARYLSGIIAGMMTKTNQIGYVAAMPNSEVNRGISAFALGVRRVNANAQILVSWTGEWDDEEKETIAANTLIEEANVDVLTYHQNQTYVAKAAENAGIYCIGYHVPLEDASSKYLTAVESNWNLLYEELISEFLKGKGNHQKNYWIGLEKDCVGLSEYSKAVTAEIIAEVEAAKMEIISGKDVFSGTIYDNEGNLKCGADEVISDNILLDEFDWFTEGVRIYE